MRILTRSSLAVAIVFSSTPLAAQDVTVHGTTEAHFYGGLGKLMSFASRFGGGDKDADKSSTTYISGHKMRTDIAKSSTIIDADAGRITSIDHKEKTYTSLTFDEMAQMAKQMQDSMQVAMQRAKERPKEADQKGDVKIDYQVSVDRPGDKSKIAGYDAERLFMTITTKADVTPEGEKTQEAGKMVFLIDEWVSKDAPQTAAMKEFTRAYGEKAGRAFREETKSMQAAFGSNPQLKQGFEAAGKERAKLPGVALRSTTYVVFVPAGMEFDREVVLTDAAATPKADEGQKKGGGGLRGMMRGIQKAAEDANKKGDKPAEPPKQGTMMSIITEVQSVEKGHIDAAMFSPPAEYREIKPKLLPAR